MPVPPKPVAPRPPELFKAGIAVIGMGRWGTSLHAALVASGHPPVETVSRLQVKRRRGADATSVDFAHARLQAEVLWLCVPDSGIEPVVAAIVSKRPSLRGQIVVHSSGVYSSAILAEAARAGARTASVHPMMTFPTRRPVGLTGVPFAVEAGNAVAHKFEKLVRQLGGLPFRLPAEGKALYHAAAVMASPLLVSLAVAARQTAMQAGLTGEHADALLEPIMLATIRNFFRRGGTQSFSGPFARGDAHTISLHLEALQAHPFQQAVYTALAGHAMDVLPVTGKRALQKALAAAKNNILS